MLRDRADDRFALTSVVPARQPLTITMQELSMLLNNSEGRCGSYLIDQSHPSRTCGVLFFESFKDLAGCATGCLKRSPCQRLYFMTAFETGLARLPEEVREGIMEPAHVPGLEASQVLRALLVAQVPPRQSSPQVSSTARRQRGSSSRGRDPKSEAKQVASHNKIMLIDGETVIKGHHADGEPESKTPPNTAPWSSRSTPSTTCIQYNRRAACQHHRSTGLRAFVPGVLHGPTPAVPLFQPSRTSASGLTKPSR